AVDEFSLCEEAISNVAAALVLDAPDRLFDFAPSGVWVFADIGDDLLGNVFVCQLGCLGDGERFGVGPVEVELLAVPFARPPRLLEEHLGLAGAEAADVDQGVAYAFPGP